MDVCHRRYPRLKVRVKRNNDQRHKSQPQPLASCFALHLLTQVRLNENFHFCSHLIYEKNPSGNRKVGEPLTSMQKKAIACPDHL